MEPLPPNTHPAIRHVMQFFTYAHLPEPLAGASKPFCTLADSVARQSPRSPETTVALRDLLKAKDSAVRAAIDEKRIDAEGHF